MPPRTFTLALAVMAGACTSGDEAPGADDAGETAPPVLATNAFYYYDDVEAAWAFYTRTLGLRTVADYGFAKIMEVAPASYLTLVDAAEGMHGTDEPRTVTFAFVTDEVEEWYAYLSGIGVPLRSELRAATGRPHDGFVAIDPEGYLLEFERFNPHPENDRLLPVLEATEPIYPDGSVDTGRPVDLGIRASVLWLYYRDLAPLETFWSEALGRERIVDQGWAKVYPASATGYVGLVDGARGLHQATEEKSVTVSFFTDDVDGWLERMRARSDFELRTPEIVDESGRVRVFVGYDPGGYFVEWDTFLDVAGNEELLRRLVGVRGG